MVHRIFPDYLPTHGATMAGAVFAPARPEPGLHAGAAHCHPAAAYRGLSLLADLGKRTDRQLRRAGQCAAGIAFISGLPGWTALHHLGGAPLSDCALVCI